MRKTIALLLIILSCASGKTSAQSFFTGEEYGFSFGGSEYFGDLNENYGFSYVRPAGGLFARIYLTPYIGVRFSANYAKVGYDDKYSSNAFNKTRNLSFSSDVGEVAMQMEFNFFRFSTGELHSRFTPYLTGGIGAFYYNPYAELNGSRYNLKKIGTEGQYVGYAGRIYSNFSLCVPIGVGVKYWVVPGVNVGFEIADRLTFTDYLDDVSTTYVDSKLFDSDPGSGNPTVAYQLQDRSGRDGSPKLGRDGKQRGNSSTRDQYMMFVFNLSFQFKTYKCPSYLKEGYYMY